MTIFVRETVGCAEEQERLYQDNVHHVQHFDSKVTSSSVVSINLLSVVIGVNKQLGIALR